MTRLRRSTCAVVRASMPMAESIDALPVPMADHAGKCLRCQAEFARVGSTRRALAGLAAVAYSAPGSLHDDIMRAIEVPVPKRTHRHGAVAAGVAAAGVAALLLWRRSRAHLATH